VSIYDARHQGGDTAATLYFKDKTSARSSCRYGLEIHSQEDTMRHVILRLVFLFVFVPFLFSGVSAFAAQIKADAKNPEEQCVKSGKPFSDAKTKNEFLSILSIYSDGNKY
jgi:hypothetical protein